MGARACPPHRLVDLEHLANQLDLPHLAGICSFSRFQRIQRGDLLNSTANQAQQLDIPSSSFQRDLSRVVDNPHGANVKLLPAAHDEDQEEEEEEEEEDCDDDEREEVEAKDKPLVAHIDVLARYPFFEKLLTGDFSEGKAARDGVPVVLQDVDRSSLRALLQWIYTGDRSIVNQDNVATLLTTSLCFGVDDLAQVCEAFLLEALHPENAADIYELATCVQQPRLELAAKVMAEADSVALAAEDLDHHQQKSAAAVEE